MTPRPEVPGVRPGVERTDRDDETEPVGGGDFASAPVLGQGDRHLVIHKNGVGLYQDLGTKVVLLDPTETPTSQRWGVFSNQRLQSDVAGVSDQRGAHTGRQAGDPRTSLAHVGEGVGKSCPCVDLEQQLPQVYLRQHPLGQRAELYETRWILESIQPGEDEFLALACCLNPNRSVLPPAVGCAPVRFVELPADVLEEWLRRRRQIPASDTSRCALLPP